MIRHIVLFRARPAVSDAQIAALFADLHAITPLIPGMSAVHAGRSDSPENLERGYMHGFTIDFADATALAAYAVHPAHVRLAGALVAMADGPDGILVFDLPVHTTP
jgi:hypothetical protein